MDLGMILVSIMWGVTVTNLMLLILIVIIMINARLFLKELRSLLSELQQINNKTPRPMTPLSQSEMDALDRRISQELRRHPYPPKG